MRDFKETIFWMKNRLFRLWAYKAYKDAMRYDALSGEEKEKIEFTRMKELVEYAYQYVPFYKEYYDLKGFCPSMLHSPKDWDKVPVLEKDIVRFQTERLVSTQFSIKDLSQSSTSGSTGTPLKVYKEKKIPVEVMGWRAFYWWKMCPSENMAKLHRNAADTFTQKLKNRFIWWPTKRVYLNSSTVLTDDVISTFVQELNDNRIQWIQGYSSTIETVADYLLKYNLTTPTLKMIWWTSSPLTPLVRKKIEAAFGCDVMNQYGCNEMWNIAIQKRKEPYLTVCSDFVHVDTIDKDGKQTPTGDIGDILITDLNCKAFPLIKYRLGDKGSFAKTAIESEDGYPKLNFVEGRISDNILLPDGSKIDGVYLTAICDMCPDSISAYQVYQDIDYTVILRLVLKDGIKRNNREIEKLYKQLGEIIGDAVPYRMEFLDSIQPVKGKKRYIISEIV